MAFEFDPNKSNSNKIRHGIDFLEIQFIWNGWVNEVPATSMDERRWFCFGAINGVIWVALITKRNGNIRIFSARRANVRERKKF